MKAKAKAKSRTVKSSRAPRLARLVGHALELGARRRGFGTFRPGVDIMRLAGSGNGPTAALLRYAPGARVPAHVHPGFEIIYVLSGAQSDERGTYAAGTLVVNRSGDKHSVWSEEGCLVLIIWEKSIEFV